MEQVLKGSLFVPNDTQLGLQGSQVAIITGPNMAGKSTYMRQVALIVLLAQIGCFVPARSAHIGVVDRLFTRIGASDDLAAGQSTFMVEMTEVADILRNATPAPCSFSMRSAAAPPPLTAWPSPGPSWNMPLTRSVLAPRPCSPPITMS